MMWAVTNIHRWKLGKYLDGDTQKRRSLISKDTYDKMHSSATLPPLNSEQIKLHTYTDEEVNVLGSVSVTAQSEICTYT